MAVYRWVPTATNTKETVVVTIGATVVRVRILLGGETITGALGTTCVEAVENFIASVAAGNHPYFNQYKYTWSGTTAGGTLTLEAREAGVDISEMGLTGVSPVSVFIAAWATSGTFTAASGRCHVDDVKNWRDSSGAIPASIPTAADTVIIDDTDEGLVWGFENLSGGGPYDIDWDYVYIGENFTGAFGLNKYAMTKNYDGKQTAEIAEYRATGIYFSRNLVLEIRGTPIRFQALLRHVNDTDILRIDIRNYTPQRNSPAVVCIWLDDTGLGSNKAPAYQVNGGSVMFGSVSSANRYLRPTINQANGRTLLKGTETSATAAIQITALNVSGGDSTLDGLSIGTVRVRNSGTVFARIALIRTIIELYGGIYDMRAQLLADYSAATIYGAGGRLRSAVQGVYNAFSARQLTSLANEDDLTWELTSQFYGTIATSDTPAGSMEMTIR